MFLFNYITGWILTVDSWVNYLFASFRSPGLTKIFSWITLLGQWQVVIGFALAASLLLWVWKKRDFILYLWLALAIDELFNNLGKFFIHRARPENAVYFENSFSFPSGHAMISIVFYGLLGFLLIRHLKNRKWKIVVFCVCFVLAVAIGLSRLYLGVHYLSDVCGGYLLGLLIFALITTLYKKKNGTFGVKN